MRPAPLLEYRPNQKLELLREPLLAMVPFSFGSAMSAAVGAMREVFRGTRHPEFLVILGATLLTFAFVLITTALLLALLLVLRNRLSRKVLSARSDTACFVAGLSFGALVFPITELFRWWNLEMEEQAILMILAECLGVICAAVLLVHPLRIKAPR
jgi:hypothetical protein